MSLPCKSGHKESRVYNPFWRCSNEQEAQEIYEGILKRVRLLIVEEGRRISELSRELGASANLLRNWVRHSTTDKIEPFPGKGCLMFSSQDNAGYLILLMFQLWKQALNQFMILFPGRLIEN